VALTRLFFDNCAGRRWCDAGFSGCAAAQPYRKEDQAGYAWLRPVTASYA
jgi:hypothetical protein